MNDAPADIKARLSIEDLVSQYVQLKKVGRSLKGLCPFHAEKSPSFVVSPERGIAYCFGCHKGGDIFAFMQEIEGVDFVDALKLLAERTGVELPKYKLEKRAPPGEKEQLLRIHELATAFYEKSLWETKDGEKVLEYLQGRGINETTIRLFRVGFAPDSYEKTHTLLLEQGFTKKMLIASGLAMAKETTFETIYDRFRGRLMFPISDSLGRVIGFGGRALKKDQEPKYLNSPETLIYHKSHVLYGFAHAKNAIKAQQTAVVVEGYMDVLASFQAGVKNVVASSGTAFTSEQLRLLQPFAKTLVLAFDMDLAGQEAARRTYDLTLDFDFQIKVLQLPGAKDIAEFANTHEVKLSVPMNNVLPEPEAAGAKNTTAHPVDVQGLIDQASLYGEYWYDRLLKTYGTSDIVAQRKILQEFYPFFTMLKGSIEKDFFVRKLAHDLGLNEVKIYDEMKSYKLPKYHPARTHQQLPEAQALRAKKYRSDELLLGFMLEFPRITHLFESQLTEQLFGDELKAIYNAFSAYYNGQGLEKRSEGFIGSLPDGLAAVLGERIALLSLYVAEYYGEMSEEAVEKEMKVLIGNLQKAQNQNRRSQLQLRLQEAEKSGDKSLREKLLNELHSLYIA